jgi:glycosyltransferase involved in cell wall biosynthesis
LKREAAVTVISDTNEGGFDDLTGQQANHTVVSGLASRRNLRHLRTGWRNLMDVLRTTPADMIWLHAPSPALMVRLAMVLRIWRPQCPVMYTYHSQPFAKGHQIWTRIIFGLLEYLLLAASPPHHIIFLTDAMATQSRYTMGPRVLERHTIHVLPNCSDLGPLRPTNRQSTRHLVMTARASRQKDHKRALRLFAALPDDTTLTLCGPGTKSAAFRRIAGAILTKQAMARITFAGPVRDVRPYLAQADGYLLSSHYEGLPIGALEAFEVGIPIILRNFDGAADLARVHPAALCLTLDNPTIDAQEIVKLIDITK